MKNAINRLRAELAEGARLREASNQTDRWSTVRDEAEDDADWGWRVVDDPSSEWYVAAELHRDVARHIAHAACPVRSARRDAVLLAALAVVEAACGYAVADRDDDLTAALDAFRAAVGEP